MRNWIVPRDQLGRSDDEGASAHYFLDVQRRANEPSVAPGDRLLLFSLGREEVKFVSQAEVQPRTPHPLSAPRDLRPLPVSEPVALSHSHDLDYFLYSLTFVKDLERPTKYFEKSLRSIPPHDFDTIVRGNVFHSRDTFYRLYRPLPPRLQVAYQTHLVAEGLINDDLPFYKRATTLLEFLAEEVLPVLEQLHHTATSYDQIKCPGKPLFEQLAGYEYVPESQRFRVYHFGLYGSVATEVVRWGAEFGDSRETLTQAVSLLTELRRSEEGYEEFPWTPPY